MAWKLWWLTALLAVLLASTGAAVDISIIGGSEVNIGDKAEIQCSYTDLFLYLPNFIINGVTIESTNLKKQLSDYNQSHSLTCTGGCSATYTLTLSNVSRGYNGTTYQCSVWPDGSINSAVKSGTVSLTVREPPTGGTSSAKEGTAGTGPSQTSSTTAPPLVSNIHATTSIVVTTTQKLGVLDASKTVPHDGTDALLDSTSLTRSNIQLVYTTAMPSPFTTDVTMASKAPTRAMKNTIDVKSSVTMMTSVAMTTTTSTVTPTEGSNKVVKNVISTIPTSTVTPMASSSVVYSSKVVTASTSLQLSLVNTTSLGASVTQTTLPSPTTEVVNRVDDDVTTVATTTVGPPTINVTSSVTMMTSVAMTTTTSTVTPTEGSNKVVTNVISSVPTSKVTPMASSSVIYSGKVVTASTSSQLSLVYTTSLGASVAQTTQPSPTTEVVNRVDDDDATTIATTMVGPPTSGPDNNNTAVVTDRVTAGADKESTDAPSYVNVVIGSVTGVTVYLLTIILIGLVIHFGVKAKKNRSKGNKFPTLPPTPPPPPAQVVEMTHNPVYEGIPAPPAYEDHIDFAGNRDVLVNMDVRYHDVPGRKSVAVESLYDYVQ